MFVYYFSDLVSELSDLQELYLDNNNLHTVHMAAFDGTSMRVLHLQNNQLDFQNIEEILENNRLDFENMGDSWDFERVSPFQKLDQLQVLNMRNNSMRTFLNDWHFANIALKELDVSYNQIEMIHFRDISNNWIDNIKINISNNQITTISADKNIKLNETQSQIVWILNHNPLHCDCLVVHFLRILQNSTVSRSIKFITNQLECSSPKRFAKQRLETVPLTELTCPMDMKNQSKKQCPEKCTCLIRTVDSTAVFNCSNANLTKIPTLPSIKSVHIHLQSYELYIENNNISTLATNSTGYENVNRIFAKNNSIENILPEHLPNNLFELDLSANKLKRINPFVLSKLSGMKSLQNVSFGQNPWFCDCATYELMNFIRIHITKIVGINEISCENHKSLSLIDANVCPIEKKTIIIILISVIAFLLLLTVLCYKNLREIKVWLFAHNISWIFINTPKDEDHKEHDAFILYSKSDENFVDEHLVKQLEKGPKPLKICLLMREMQGGDIIADKVS